MAGGGTGGHVVPSLAVAGELRKRGHDAVFVGTRQGMEATLVPRAGFGIEWIDIGGFQRVGAMRQIKTMVQLPVSIVTSARYLLRLRAAAVFSMGGYVAAPVMIAADLLRLPILVMEPNAMPGLVARRMARRVARALVSFTESQQYFPAGRSEVTGLPVRSEFFALPQREPGELFTVLVTGGSRGSRALNHASRACWPMLRDAPFRVRFMLQCGAQEYELLAAEFNQSGIEGEVTRFIQDMPAAYGQADLIVSRAGAGAVSEIAAAGKPSLLVPFPYAADDHQRHNAEAMSRPGAALMVLEKDFGGTSLFQTIDELRLAPERLLEMGRKARALARPGAAERTADLLEEFGGRIDTRRRTPEQ